jgi:hypothetical protein
VRFIADAHQIIQAALDDRLRQARAIILHRQAEPIVGDRDLCHHPCRVARIKGIIDQLFGEGNRPVPPGETDLHLQFTLGEEL